MRRGKGFHSRGRGRVKSHIGKKEIRRSIDEVANLYYLKCLGGLGR